MIDTHNHILHRLDDGPSERKESLDMARIAWEDGIRTIVATPHFNGNFANTPEHIRSAVSDLNNDLVLAGSGLRIVPGMEARVSASLVNDLRSGRILPINDGRYVLLEFQAQHVPTGFENLVHHFLEAGFSVVLAHPEKNLLIQRNPMYVFNVLERFEPWQLLMQITADSLTGDSGFWAAQTARLLLKCGLAHLIATDAHSSNRRAPFLSRAKEKASSLVGEERASQMVHDIPLAILEGKDFPPPFERKQPKPWWRIF